MRAELRKDGCKHCPRQRSVTRRPVSSRMATPLTSSSKEIQTTFPLPYNSHNLPTNKLPLPARSPTQQIRYFLRDKASHRKDPKRDDTQRSSQTRFHGIATVSLGSRFLRRTRGRCSRRIIHLSECYRLDQNSRIRNTHVFCQQQVSIPDQLFSEIRRNRCRRRSIMKCNQLR